METEFLHDFENFSNFGSQGSGLNLAGTFFEKVIDHELAFRDDIPQPDYWLSPLDDFGSSSLSPSALSLRGDGCDFSLRDLNHAFDTSDLQREDVNNLDSWATPSDDLAEFSDFSFIKQEREENFRDKDESLLGVTNVSDESSFKSEYYSFEDESHIDVESVDGVVSDVPEYKNDRPSFHHSSSTSPVQSAGSPKPIKPCSLLEKHLRSPIQTIINAAQRPSSINSCTRLNNCKIIREASTESSGRAKSNSRKQKIPIAQAIPNKKVESSSNRMIDAGRTLNRNKLIKLVTTGSSGETILLDHDYCSNSSKNTFGASALEPNDTKRLPLRQSEFESVHVSANKVASVKVTHNGSKPKEASKDFSKTKPVKSKEEAMGSKFADAQSFTSNKISKIKSCDNETAFRKDALPESIVQSSATKDRGKSSISLEDTPSDSKITQTHVPEKQKVTLKEPVMVSLLNKSTASQDPLKVVLPDNACNGKKKNSNIETALPEGTYNDKKTSSENETSLPDSDKNKYNTKSASSTDVQGIGKSKSSSNDFHANGNNQKSSFSGVKVKKGDKKRKNKFIESTTKHSSSKTVIVVAKEQSTSKSRSGKDEKSHSSKVDVQPENFSKSNSHANAKKPRQEDKKVAEPKSTGNQSTSHLKDLTKSAKTVINNFKNNSKSDLNLPIRNSNVISSDNIKEAHLGGYQSEIGLPNCKRKEAAQNSSACSVESQENESCEKSSNIFKKEDLEEKAATMSTSPQGVNVLHVDKAFSASEDSDLGIQSINLKVSTNEKAVTSENLDKSDCKIRGDYLKTELVEKEVCTRSEDKSFSQDQNGNGVEKCVSESEKCSVDAEQSNEANLTNFKASENGEKSDLSNDLPIKCEPITSAETLPVVDSTTSSTHNEDSMDNSTTLEDRSSEAVANVKEKPVSVQNPSSIATKKEGNLEKVVSTNGKKRKLNLSEYRDRQRKRLDPGIMFVAKWKVPLIELDSSVTDPANRRSFRDLINQVNEAKAKTMEPVSSTTDIPVIDVESVKVDDGAEKTKKKSEDAQDVKKKKEVTQNSRKNDDVSRSMKKNKEVQNSKTHHEEGAKKVETKQVSTSVKERNPKRRSRSSNGKDPSSERSKRCRSSRSSSGSNKSPKRYRRRTPISYRPSSRSSFSSNSSSSRSPSRSRSHSRSRSYRNRSYRYRNDYRRRSRESDRRSRDYYRHRDRSNRYRSRSREDRRRSRDDRTRSRDRRTRSREDRHRSRENSYHSKNYRQDRSSSSSRKTSSLSPVRSEVYRPLQSRNYNISPVDIAIAEGRMIYIGKIENVSQSDLLDRFKEFGPIVDVNLHFKEYGKNYGFITFKYACDAKRAIKYGNDNKSLPQYDICYGGRRQVCSDSYADLSELYGLANLGYSPYHSVVDASVSSKKAEEEDSFDALLQDFRRAVSERTQKEI